MSREPMPGGADVDRSPLLAVIELGGGGHRLWYVRLILEAARELIPLDRLLVITTAEARATDEWALHLAPIVADEQVQTLDARATDPMMEALELGSASGAFVVVPDGDHYLRRVRQWPRDLRGSLLVVRAHPQPGIGGRLRHAVKLRAIKTASRRTPKMRILSLEMTEQSQHPAMRRLGVDVALDPIRFEPHDVTPQSWLHRHGVPTATPVALAIGDLSERKYVPEILQAWQADPQDVTLVLVGRPSATVERLAHAAQAAIADDSTRSLALHFGACSDADFDTWIASADAVFALHRNPGASGVTLKAWTAGVSLVVNDAPLTRQVCDELSVDALCVDGSPASLRHAFGVIAASPRRDRTSHAPVRSGHEVPLAMLRGLFDEGFGPVAGAQ